MLFKKTLRDTYTYEYVTLISEIWIWTFRAERQLVLSVCETITLANVSSAGKERAANRINLHDIDNERVILHSNVAIFIKFGQQ